MGGVLTHRQGVSTPPSHVRAQALFCPVFVVLVVLVDRREALSGALNTTVARATQVFSSAGEPRVVG